MSNKKLTLTKELVLDVLEAEGAREDFKELVLAYPHLRRELVEKAER